MSVDLSRFSSTLVPGSDGLWHATREEAISYPDNGNRACHQLEDSSFWFRHRNRCIAALVARLRPSGPLFDIGGGNGYVSDGLRSVGLEAVVVEPGIHGALAARARGLSPVVCATLDTAGFVHGSLPAVGLFDVVEHVQEDRLFLRQVFDAMQAGGLAFVTVPAHAWLWSDEDVEAGHFRRYSRESMVSTLSDAGFVVEYITYFFRWMPVPVFVLRTLPSLLGLGRSPSATRHRVAHAGGTSASRRLIDWLLRNEAASIQAGRTSGVGASLLVAARKPVGLPDGGGR